MYNNHLIKGNEKFKKTEQYEIFKNLLGRLSGSLLR